MILSKITMKIQLPKLRIPKIHFHLNLPIKWFNFSPHFPRIFPALTPIYHLKHLIWPGVIAIMLLNFFHSPLLGFTPFVQLRYRLLQYPQNLSLHILLGNYYLSRNLPQQADKEYELAKYISHNPQVLGLSTNSPDSTPSIPNQKVIYQKQVDFWQNIVTLYPQYTYGYLKLGEVLINLGEKQKARYYVNYALNQDPTNIFALELKSAAK